MKIAIHGPMCSGKTTISKIIKKYDSSYRVYSFGLKIKQIATELFNMEGKDRSLLINIANKMKEIDQDIWAKYVINQIEKDNSENCIIDDLRFQNEAEYLNEDWLIISLTTPKDIRIKRIKDIYKENYEDHIKNMDDISETSKINLPQNTIYLDCSMEMDDLENYIKKIILC